MIFTPTVTVISCTLIGTLLGIIKGVRDVAQDPCDRYVPGSIINGFLGLIIGAIVGISIAEFF